MSLVNIDDVVRNEDNEPAMTYKRLAELLDVDYKGLMELGDRHADELGVFETVCIIPTVSGRRESRSLLERGIFLISMWSQSEKAKEIRIQITKILEEINHTGKYELQVSDDPLDAYINASKQVTKALEEIKVNREQVRINTETLTDMKIDMVLQSRCSAKKAGKVKRLIQLITIKEGIERNDVWLTIRKKLFNGNYFSIDHGATNEEAGLVLDYLNDRLNQTRIDEYS